MKYIDTGQVSMAEFHSLSKVCFLYLCSVSFKLLQDLNYLTWEFTKKYMLDFRMQNKQNKDVIYFC